MTRISFLRSRRPTLASGADPDPIRPQVRPRTAVVLSGGGHLGAIQVGMLRALVEYEIEPDVYVACSVGALNATLMAAFPGHDGIDMLEQVWLNLRTEDVFDGNPMLNAWRLARQASHIYSNSGLVRLITSAVPVTHFHQLQTPLRIVATEVRSGTERVFAAGPLLRPLLATTALPGVFPPVRIGSDIFVDGGIVNNVPINHAAAADVVYVLALTEPSTYEEVLPRSGFGLLLRSFSIARSTRYRVDLDRYSEQTEVIVFPQPRVPDIRFPDLSKSEVLMEAGYEAASRHLDQLRIGRERDLDLDDESGVDETITVTDSETAAVQSLPASAGGLQS